MFYSLFGQMSLVDLGKRLLDAARKGQDDEVRNLMANGAPFTTDWVRRHVHADVLRRFVLDWTELVFQPLPCSKWPQFF